MSRDAARYDSFRPRSRSRSASPRRWDQGDSWVDPSFRKRPPPAGRQEQRNGKDTSQRGHELLDRLGPSQSQAFQRAVAGAGIVIRGAADRRQSLLERLARAKAEGEAGDEGRGEAGGVHVAQSPPAAEAEGNGHSAGGDRAAELREQLMVERKARQLREQLLARKRARNAVAEAALDVKARGARTGGSPAKEGGGREGADAVPASSAGTAPATAEDTVTE